MAPELYTAPPSSAARLPETEQLISVGVALMLVAKANAPPRWASLFSNRQSMKVGLAVTSQYTAPPEVPRLSTMRQLCTVGLLP